MGETDMKPANIISDAMRNFCSFLLDKPAYWLLGIIYQLFFNVASADLFSNGTILEFYKRIQLILGVFMMFQLAMTIIKGIMAPDSFTDSKNGAGTLIKRVAISLILLSVLVPINIPNAQNEWEIQLNNHGLLFGAMYSLQNRILSNNTLGRLILGTDAEAESFTESDPDDEDSTLAKSTRTFTSAIIKGFYRINLLPEKQRTKHEPGKEDAIFNENRVCKDIDDEVLNAYTRLDAKTSDLINMVDLTCEYPEDAETDPLSSVLSIINSQWNGKKRYVFAYTPIIPAVVGFIFAFILLSFTIDVAVRAVKLAVLRLIAPIPIISYMDPKGGKDAAFNSWVKTLISTYLDLFIRLAVVYFVIFLIQDMIVHGVAINKGTGLIGLLSMILVWIGLFVFAKQAPKFIKSALGMKDDGGKFFSGFGELGALGAAGLGIAGAAATNYRASKEENAALHGGQIIRNGFRNVGSSIAGAISGGYTGIKAFAGKDASAKNVIKALDARNSMRAAHSTAMGRLGNNLYGLATGSSLATRGNNTLKGAQDFIKAQGDWKKSLESEAKANGAAFSFKDSSGKKLFDARYEEVERALESASDGKVRINGNEYDANMFTQSYMDDRLKDQVKYYQSGSTKSGGKAYTTLIQPGQKLYAKRQDVIRATDDIDLDTKYYDESTGKYVQYNGGTKYNVDDSSTFGPNIGAANAIKSKEENSMRQRMRRANDQNKK